MLSAYKDFSGSILVRTPEYMRIPDTVHLAPLLWDYSGFNIDRLRDRLEERIQTNVSRMGPSGGVALTDRAVEDDRSNTNTDN